MRTRWSVLAGSVAGGAHARAGVSGQDAYAVREVDGLLLLVVADGAGGRRCAAAGASLVVALATQVFVALVRDRPPGTAVAWSALLDAARDQLFRRFRRAARALARAAGGFRPEDLATTVTVVVAHPPWVGVLAVGDGVVVVRTDGDDLALLAAPPDVAGRPPGATALLPTARAVADTRRLVARLPDLTGLAVCTDGLDSLLVEYDGTRPSRPGAAAFGQLFALAEVADPDPTALTRLLCGRRVGALTDDDRTLVLAVPR
ncbi:protein phosphatase 2C domain-containing protein [Micromonospora sp. NBC_01655]|uniref:protein phosphatase 2C domain-containing protein n=1 Tax=Micromonospora sp. NBC_01655 TaxID=2975983 RepID=UPI002259B762|nr:protein phosphatase 2C domain-containing protein [Micromonospora sp. NBC_01655]MCX4473575.1 protein phosphatase 2C domain-containing protein [Micromonospora sp. NBC_01655]